MRLPVASKKGPQREPFMKNIFLGPFDKEILYFPEPQSKDRHTRFYEWLQSIERYVSDNLKDPQNVNKNEVLSHLRDLGVFRSNVEEQHLGLRLNHSEQAKVVEVLSALPWLGSYMVNNHIAPLNVMYNMATADQKAKYLPKIATGECVPTVCFTEPDGAINTDNINTMAMLSECSEYWVLNGEKALVANGQDSNLFIVFGQCNHHPFVNPKHSTFSVFLVERNFSGITCESVNSLVGRRPHNHISTITFKDTKVPKENVMENATSVMKVLVDFLAPGNRHIAPQAIGTLRNFTKLLLKYILQRKHLNRDLHEYEGIQEVIGKTASTLYGMESALYMTTGMMDLHENQDCALENAMVETYCASECVARIYEGLQIIGAHSYLRENPYMEILEDALSYTLFDSYNLESNTYIGLLGLQHSGKYLREHIFKLRNPMYHPDHILRWLFGKDEQLKLDLGDHMHPSLSMGSELLEKCLARLQTCTWVLLKEHGKEVTNRQMDVRRLSELATRTFVLIAVFSRASRAYCIGLRNAEMDQQAAGSIAILTLDRIKVLAEEIQSTQFNNGDRFHKKIAELMFNKKDYFAEHPLDRSY
ncbi:Acyl-CoA dehydrogenase family member 9, mitochondrial [Ooceraea biroi]|nr:Acyl-CoA dehydrogenase family member 9, mitochondrial [Ooceraea biroi]